LDDNGGIRQKRLGKSGGIVNLLARVRKVNRKTGKVRGKKRHTSALGGITDRTKRRKTITGKQFQEQKHKFFQESDY